MPSRPARICTGAGCSTLVRDGGSRCERHVVKAWARRGDEPERLRGRAGVERRRRWLERHPLCVMCEREGRITAGEQVDHRIPLSQGGADDLSNMQTLCRRHHDDKTARERGTGGSRIRSR